MESSVQTDEANSKSHHPFGVVDTPENISCKVSTTNVADELGDDIFEKVYDQLAQNAALLGLKTIYYEVKEQKWIMALIITFEMLLCISVVDFVVFSRQHLNSQSLMKLVNNSKYSFDVLSTVVSTVMFQH